MLKSFSPENLKERKRYRSKLEREKALEYDEEEAKRESEMVLKLFS